jgi:hypothetical protein
VLDISYHTLVSYLREGEDTSGAGPATGDTPPEPSRTPADTADQDAQAGLDHGAHDDGDLA